MSTRMAQSNVEELKKYVDDADYTGLVGKLAEDLGKYGFSGNISLDLTVTIVDRTTDATEAKTSRSFYAPFRH